jgi:signal transduction histidine kinase
MEGSPIGSGGRATAAPLAWGLAALAVGLLVAATVVSVASGSDVDAGISVFIWAIGLGFAIAGLLIAVRQPRNAIGWIFLGTAVTAGLGALAGSYADYWVDARAGSEILGKTAALYASLSWMPFILVPSTFLLLLFPDGRPLSPSWRPVAWCAGIGIAAGFVLTGLHPGPIEDYPEIGNPYGVDSAALDVLEGLAVLAIVIGILGSALSLILRFRRSSGERRQQMKWLAFTGAVAALTITVGVALYDVLGETAANVSIMLSVLGLPTATGVAILRHRLYDIDVVINRTLVYAVLTAGLAALYAAISLSLGVALGAGSTLPTAAATLAVALAFRPLRSRVQVQVDRRFDRARYEGLRKVESFLEDLHAGRAVPESTGEVMAQALGDPRFELFFWLPTADVHVDAAGQVVDQLPAAGRAVTPVRRGTLELASAVHDPALAEHPDLLESVISAAGLAIEIARLRVEVRTQLAEVEASRARIVTVGYEERRRLERDLHDGAQQRLVSIGLALRDVQRQLPPAIPATTELDATVGELTEAINELRELARGVRPAGLDDGLGAALRELAARSSLRTRVEATDDRFEDRVETAAYFVASEALTNATKHARASEVEVSALRRDGSLVVCVRDDGKGGAAAADGSGLLGMSDRVAALGGSVSVHSPRGRGTVITAELPCAS